VTRKQALRLLRCKPFLQRCVAQGMTVRQIAAGLGVARSSVREWMRRHQVAPNRDRR
jgi:transposase